jgi:hypothetical protein
LIRGKTSGLLLILLLFCGYGVTFSYRSARYDVVGMVWCAMLFLEYAIANRNARWLAMFLTAALLPATGLQLVPFAFFTAVVILIFLRRKVFVELVIVGLGIVVGGAILLGVFRLSHVLPQFKQSTLAVGTGPHGLVGKLMALKGEIGGELPAVILMIGFVAALAVIPASVRSRRNLSLALVGLGFGIVIPCGMAIVGRFPVYYTWMMFLPTAVCFAACADGMARLPGGRRGYGVLVIVGLIACYGLPARLVKATREWHQNDPAGIQQFVQSIARPSDVIFCGFPPYLAARQITPDVLTIPYLPAISAAERQSVSLLIINPADADNVMHGIGGQWSQIGTYYPPGVTDNRFYPFGPSFYLMNAYRRSPGN